MSTAVFQRDTTWGRDAAAHAWTLICNVKGCFFTICADTEDDAWFKLEVHQESDYCPTPRLYHGEGMDRVHHGDEVQTFLPCPEFEASAQVLDRLRLGKQRVETLQILNSLTGKTESWKNHPAVKMWRGHERSLCLYGMAICSEWCSRDYQDTLYDKFEDLFFLLPAVTGDNPPWLGDESFHASHRSNLLRKDPQWYGQFEWDESPGLGYIWPVR